MKNHQDQYNRGLQIRREVMGDTHVNKALSSANSFSAPIQELAIRNAWGEVWDREGISRQTRSLVTIATLAALKATNELKGHVLGALRNGCSTEEIQEVLLHSSVYCGMPSGLSAFKSAKEAIDEWQAENNKN